MTSTRTFLINPGPVDDAGKHSHRVGASNHHHISGSGDNPMVGNSHLPSTPLDAATVDAVRVQIHGQSHRFLSLDDRGRLTVRLDRLTLLVTEIVAGIVAGHTESLRAELDAANDAVVDLLADLDAALRAQTERGAA